MTLLGLGPTPTPATPAGISLHRGANKLLLTAMVSSSACFLVVDWALLHGNIHLAMVGTAAGWAGSLALMARGAIAERRYERDIYLKLGLNHLPVAVFVANRKMKITSCWGAAVAAAGIDPESLVGRQVGSHFNDPRVTKLYMDALAGRHTSTIHFHEGREYVSHGVPVDGESACVLVTTVDITSMTSLRAETKAAVERLRWGRECLDRPGPVAAGSSQAAAAAS